MRFTTWLVAGVTALAWPAASSGQLGPLPGDDPLADDWRWAHFDVRSGLPSSEVVGFTHDAEGRFWVATSQGVAWFDGFRWRPTEVPDSGAVQAIAPDLRRGVIVLAGGRAFRGDTLGLSRMDLGVSDRVRRVAVLDSDRTAVLTVDSAFVLGSPPGEELPAAFAAPLFALGGGGSATWMVGGPHVLRWSSSQGWEAPFEEILADQLAVGTSPAGGMVVASLGPAGSQIHVRSPNGAIERIRLPSSVLPLAAAIDDNGDAAVAYSSGALHVRRDGRWSVLSTLPASALNPTVMHFAPSGDLWVGSDRGLTVNRGSTRRWARWPMSDLPGGYQLVNEILAVDADSVWIGTSDGVAVRDRSGRIRRIGEIDGQPIGAITGLARDTDGGIWVTSGSQFDGAFRWIGGRFDRYGPPRGLSSPVHRVVADASGDLWFLGLSRDFGVNEPGLTRWTEGRLERWAPSDGLPNGRTYAFVDAGDRGVWVGTSAGLSRWLDGAWRHWRVEEGMRREPVYALAVDGDGCVWFGHGRSGGGAGFVDADDNIVYPLDDTPLQDARVTALTVDAGGAIWIGSFSGLARWADHDATLLSTTEGLTAPLVWPVLPLEDRVLVGTMGAGIWELDLGELGAPPPIVEVGMLTAREGSVEVAWQAFAYDAAMSPENVETRYQIDEAGWSHWSTVRYLGPLSLPPGAHSVSVQAKGVLGQMGPVSTVSFQVPPPIWRHPIVLFAVGIWILTMGAVVTRALRRRRATIAELATREAKYRTLFQNALIGIGRESMDGEVLACNARLAEIFRYPSEEAFIQGYSRERHMRPEDVAVIRERLRQDGQLPATEVEIVRADGTDGWIRLWVYRNDDGGYIEGAVEDISERMYGELDRQRLEAQLRQAQKMETVGQLTGGVAHDFNNLLTVVQGNLELLLDARRPVVDRDLLVEEALEAARRGSTLTHRLLAFARKQPLRPRELDVRETLEGMAPLIRRAVGEDVDLELALAANLWRCEIDPHQLENALLNLALNARDAMAPGGKLTLEADNVTLRAEDVYESLDVEPGEYVRISVADTGAGMESEVAAKALEPFFTTKEVGQGSGLGLSMVYGFVKQSGGHLTVYSEPGEGTTVRLYLPRTASESAAAEDAPPPQIRVMGRGEKILVVEDDDGARSLVERMLCRLGYVAVPARDGPDALERLAEDDFSLVLTDVVLPGGLNGAELADVIRATHPGLRVVFMSGYPQDVIVHRGRLDEGVDLLEKPFSVDRLAQAVAAALEDGRG